MRSLCTLTCVVFLWTLVTSTSAAQRPTIAPPSAGQDQPSSYAESRDLARLLASNQFADRVWATRHLRQMGTMGHPILEQIASQPNSDAALAAFDLLKQAAKSSDPRLSSSAKETLSRMAAGDGPLAPLASDVLNGPRPPRSVVPRIARPQRPGAFGGPVRQQTRISITTINGIRSIEVTDNNRTFRFKDVAEGLEIERPKAGGATIKRTYKDAEELKAKDPEAYEAYSKAGGPKRSRLATPFPFLFPEQRGPAIPRKNSPGVGPKGLKNQLEQPDAPNRPQKPKSKVVPSEALIEV